MRVPLVLLAGAALAFSYQNDSRPHGTIGGEVLIAATGAPLADAIVTLRLRSVSGDDVQSVQTDDAGRFSFTGLWGHD